MKKEQTLLCNVPVGERAVVVQILNSAKHRRFLDIGLSEGTQVEALYKSPSQNPVAYRIRGAVIALRNEDVADIVVKKL